MEKFYLGIDGGATKTKFVIADKTGKIIDEITSGASNPIDLGYEKCVSVLKEGIERICNGIPYSEINLFAGISGGTSGDNQRKINGFLSGFGFHAFSNGSDAENIIAAGLKGKDGVAVIMGTGSCAFVSKGGKIYRIGGLGYLFDFAGSGYDIGAQGIASALRYEDGTGEQTSIRRGILRRTGKESVLESLGEFYSQGKAEIASYAPIVFEAYDGGDVVAESILKTNMRHTAMLIHTAGKYFNDSVQVSFVGGLTKRFDVLEPYIEEGLKQYKDNKNYEFSVLKKDVAYGALYKAGAPISE
ncbi:MAG: N-acetylglucosamine kinase [Candidatus Scatosoma sp.]